MHVCCDSLDDPLIDFGLRRYAFDGAQKRDRSRFFREIVATLHSALTAPRVDAVREPTRQARDHVLALLRHRPMVALPSNTEIKT